MKIVGFNGKFQESGRIVPTISNTSGAGGKRITEPLRPRPDASFKIKDSLRQVSQAQPVVKMQAAVQQQTRIESREPVDEVKVMAALERYVAEHHPEPSVGIALKTHHPVVETEKITIFADNQLQLEKLEGTKMHLHHILRKYLNNGYIDLGFQLFDCNTTQEEKKLFTASEKYEHFVKLNPVVADLKAIFGLELD